MNVALRKPMTLAHFLAWEERQPLRYDFDGLQPVAMAGCTAEHAAIQVNLITALRNRLRGQPCRAFGSELKIEVAGRIRYPEAFVVRTPVPPRATGVPDPVIVFETINEASAHDDLVVKSAEYRATPSVQRYVILQQTQPGAIVFSRKNEDWVTTLLTAADTLALPEIGIEIPTAELYADVPFASPSPSDEAASEDA